MLWLQKSSRNFSRVTAVVLTVVMLLSSVQVSKISNLIESATGADSKLHTVNVLVMNESKFQTVKDMNSDDKVGANLLADAKHINNALKQMEDTDKLKVTPKEYSNYFDLVAALYDGKLDAIILNQAYIPLITEVKENFEKEVRVIASYEYTEKIVNKKEPVNVLKDTFTVFVSGIDTYGSIKSVSRSDVNMLVTVNPVTNQILLTSIPRDYYVKLNKNGKKDKLTHAGLYGVDESMKTLEDLLNDSSSNLEKTIDVDYFLRVNFSSVTKIANALGGVSVRAEENFTAGGKQFIRGENYVNGQEALAFTRERYQFKGGDNVRVKHQQALMTGVLNKVMSPSIITNFSSFLSSIKGEFEFSMDDGDLNKLIKKKIDSMPSWEIIPIQLSGTGSKSNNVYSLPGRSLYVMEPNYDTVRKAAELILKMERNEKIEKQ